MKRLLMMTALLGLIPPAFALDAACEPILKASEAKLKQPAWHSITEVSGMKLEAIKVDGQFFMSEDGKWNKAPLNLDEAEKTAIEMLQNGKVKVTNCKDEGSETLNSMEMRVISYTSEVPSSGLPPVNERLYIGKDDGLPYQQSGDTDNAVKATYQYQDVTAPKL